MQAAGDVGGWNHNAVGFAFVIGVCFEGLVFFPIVLPLSFGGGGIVLGLQGGSRCGHGGNTKSGRSYLNFATG